MRKTNPKTEFQKVSLGDGRSVFLGVASTDRGGFCLDFVRPIEKDDIKDGKIIPPVSCARNKSRIHTQVLLSIESMQALKELLNRFDL